MDRRVASRSGSDHSTRVTRAIFPWTVRRNGINICSHSLRSERSQHSPSSIAASILMQALSRLFLRLPTTSFSAGRLRTVGGALRPSPSLSACSLGTARSRGRAHGGPRFEDQRIPAHRASSAAGSSAVPHLPGGKAEEEKEKETKRERDTLRPVRRAISPRAFRSQPRSRDREVDDARRRAVPHCAHVIRSDVPRHTADRSLSLCTRRLPYTATGLSAKSRLLLSSRSIRRTIAGDLNPRTR